MNLLAGKKTYIISICVAIVAGLYQQQIIDASTAGALFGILGAGGLAAVRAGVSKGPSA